MGERMVLSVTRGDLRVVGAGTGCRGRWGRRGEEG